MTRLTARWLAAGHPAGAIRAHILRGLPDDGTPVHRPGGLLRHLLRDVPPVPAPTPPVPQPPAAAPSPASERLLSPRLIGARECEGSAHVHPMLFRPVNDETLCRRCRD
ncbi:hypothetical protein L1856_28680 [Streptomyces sp. Tue 6430]|nr:hypothetical protein [Streptomyces sp. Tue 6430]